MSRINQIRLVASVCREIAGQCPGIKISQKQLAAVTAAADSICAAFNEPDMCDSCSDKLRGGCQPTCNQYQGSNGHD
ncbi:hypothetical protein AAZR23_12035 [Morganella sp. Je.2.23]|uniref:hypothetical protein n=1 Tax=Morganella sp. Je.2.23 TaxID=3142840 RepID=UPI001CA50C1E|nr:hypothetical protein [Morganella morganii]